MAPKLQSGALQYNAAPPPFLARLRGEHAAGGYDAAAQGRWRRTAGARAGSAEAEDAPVVVDEGGNVVEGVCVGRDGAVRDGREAEGVAAIGEKVAAIGAGRKRKVGKVVGGDADEEDGNGADAQPVAAVGRKTGRKDSKKAKKIKLSFGNDEEG
ncbi:hypothetical protein P8C59_002763 [Phyllachora maydis]|uniref:DUF4604 domain-containing protein n=1 Tax=Phyllachora maydis TaxID=1825666 RepID=A0AAD9HZ62_9PEZI|nr:hypothetical protein P8C59_002763 [Phyllachora maydis]